MFWPAGVFSFTLTVAAGSEKAGAMLAAVVALAVSEAGLVPLALMAETR